MVTEAESRDIAEESTLGMEDDDAGGDDDGILGKYKGGSHGVLGKGKTRFPEHAVTLLEMNKVVQGWHETRGQQVRSMISTYTRVEPHRFQDLRTLLSTEDEHHDRRSS